MAAATAVFDTFELLESILYELPMRDLLLAQRVNKQCRAIIQSSKKLQRALFFVPVEGGSMSLHLRDWTHSQQSTWLWKGAKTKSKPLCNPLLGRVTQAIYGLSSYMSETLNERLPLSWLEPNASWRRMLPTQPPNSTNFWIFSLSGYWGTDSICGSGEQLMGDAFDELERQWKRSQIPLEKRCLNLGKSWVLLCPELRSNEELQNLIA